MISVVMMAFMTNSSKRTSSLQSPSDLFTFDNSSGIDNLCAHSSVCSAHRSETIYDVLTFILLLKIWDHYLSVSRVINAQYILSIEEAYATIADHHLKSYRVDWCAIICNETVLGVCQTNKETYFIVKRMLYIREGYICTFYCTRLTTDVDVVW